MSQRMLVRREHSSGRVCQVPEMRVAELRQLFNAIVRVVAEPSGRRISSCDRAGCR